MLNQKQISFLISIWPFSEANNHRGGAFFLSLCMVCVRACVQWGGTCLCTETNDYIPLNLLLPIPTGLGLGFG